MTFKKTLFTTIAVAMVAGSTGAAVAQPIFDRMKEDAARRAENKAVREAEHPQPAAQTAHAGQTAPAETTTAQTAPAPTPAAGQ